MCPQGRTGRKDTQWLLQQRRYIHAELPFPSELSSASRWALLPRLAAGGGRCVHLTARLPIVCIHVSFCNLCIIYNGCECDIAVCGQVAYSSTSPRQSLSCWRARRTATTICSLEAVSDAQHGVVNALLLAFKATRSVYSVVYSG
jgi:hypothetical protein